MSKDSKKWEEELRKKLNEELSEGIYDISEGNLVCFTGKQGKIDLEVEVIKELNQKKKKMSKDLNKHRQVKSVDSNSMIRKNPPTREGEGFFKVSDIILVINKYPNDADLGKFIRKAILSWKDE